MSQWDVLQLLFWITLILLIPGQFSVILCSVIALCAISKIQNLDKQWSLCYCDQITFEDYIFYNGNL